MELLKKEIASIKMLVVHVVGFFFFFANSLFYRFRITLDFFLIYVKRCMIPLAIHFSESGWFYNKHIKSHIFYKNAVLVTQKNSTACCPVFCNLWFMQEYAEFQYRRRHRQRRRGDMHSLLSNTPDPDDPSESTLGTDLSGAAFFLFLLQKLLVVTTLFVLLWIHFKEVSNTLLYFPGYNIKACLCSFFMWS